MLRGINMGFDSLDLSHTFSRLDEIQESMEANQNAMIANIRLQNQVKEAERQANIETARNTSEMKNDLKMVIHNQNDYIAMLKEQNEYIKRVLNNLYGSSEDSVIVQKEILKIMQESNSAGGMITDKGLDAVIQMVFNAVQIYLKSKGIMF